MDGLREQVRRGPAPVLDLPGLGLGGTGRSAVCLHATRFDDLLCAPLRARWPVCGTVAGRRGRGPRPFPSAETSGEGALAARDGAIRALSQTES
jgi:hypothetical protein